MPRAVCLVEGRDFFCDGLIASGHLVVNRITDIEPDDVLVAWNRRARDEREIRRFEKAGANVVIAENGYVGRDAVGGKLFALARGHHAGAGEWYVGYEPRWKSQGFELKPWREGGEDILLLPQRGIGENGIAMAAAWPHDVMRALARRTKRPVRVRWHPGKNPPKKPLEDDLRGVWAAVTWGSGAAVKALALGVPVFHGLRQWIGAPAAKYGVDDIESPYLGDREAAFHRIGWAQWSAEEITSGQPFIYLRNP